MKHTDYRRFGRFARTVILTILIATIVLPVFTLGCQDMEQFHNVLPSSEFSVMQVPNVNLDLYIYAKQRALTTVPAELINMPEDIQVESLAMWGVPDENEFALGLGLTFDNEKTAAETFNQIMEEDSIWRFVRGNNLYVVKGSGVAAAALKSAIANNDFVEYHDKQLLEAAGLLPQTVRAKLIAFALANPSNELINFMGENISIGNLEQINEILKLANLKVFVGGLYSPNSVNIAKAAQIAGGDGNLADLNLGLLLAVKSGLPGILIETNVKNILSQQGLTPVKIGEFDLYKGYWRNSHFDAIPVYARIEGNYVFITVSGQESYAETLITSIYK